MTEVIRPKVGVGLLLLKGDKVLLGKRKGSHGEGEYGGTGGHLEQGETFVDCVLRELLEEAGSNIKITTPQLLCVINLRKYLPKHYVDIGMMAEWVGGEPEVTEPHKLESWDWYSLDQLPTPLFGPEEYYLQAYKTGQMHFED